MKREPREPLSGDENPGVPGFRSWKAVYVFVLLFFVLCVVALAIFSRTFA